MQSRNLAETVPAEAAERLRRFRTALLGALPDAVADVILFGSQARGEAGDDSDYDVAVLLRGDLEQARGIVDRLAFAQTIDGFDLQWVALPADALEPARCASSELAARISRDGVPVR